MRRIFCATSGGELNPEAINNGLESAVHGLRKNATALPSCPDSEPDMGFTVSVCHYEYIVLRCRCFSRVILSC